MLGIVENNKSLFAIYGVNKIADVDINENELGEIL